MMRSALLAVFVVLCPTLAAAQAGPAVAVNESGPNIGALSGPFSITYGWTFRPTTDLTITELGFSDAAILAGVGLSAAHEIGIYNASGGLVASATIPAGTSALLSNGFFYVPIAATPLLSGQLYTAAAFVPAASDHVTYSLPAGDVSFDPRVSWEASVSSPGGELGLTHPTIVSTSGEVGLFGPTFFIGYRTTTVSVQIDVKPGSVDNCLNINGAGTIPVAILGSASLNVNNVNQTTLLFEGLAVRIKGNQRPQCSVSSVNGDGYPDLVCHFVDADGAWLGGTTSATLRGQLFNGNTIEGTDSICLVP